MDEIERHKSTFPWVLPTYFDPKVSDSYAGRIANVPPKIVAIRN